MEMMDPATAFFIWLTLVFYFSGAVWHMTAISHLEHWKGTDAEFIRWYASTQTVHGLASSARATLSNNPPDYPARVEPMPPKTQPGVSASGHFLR